MHLFFRMAIFGDRLLEITPKTTCKTILMTTYVGSNISCGWLLSQIWCGRWCFDPGIQTMMCKARIFCMRYLHELCVWNNIPFCQNDKIFFHWHCNRINSQCVLLALCCASELVMTLGWGIVYPTSTTRSASHESLAVTRVKCITCYPNGWTNLILGNVQVTSGKLMPFYCHHANSHKMSQVSCYWHYFH